MSLLHFDGFDHYSTSATGKWSSYISGPDNSGTVARTGTLSFRCQNGEGAVSKTLPASGDAIIGVALYVNAGAFGTNDIILISEDAVTHIALATTAGGLLVIKRGVTVLATGTTVLPIASWNYIELRVTIHDTTGSYEVKINGVTEAALTNAGPIDTRNAGTTGQWNNVTIKGNVGDMHFDDVYVCDSSGAAPRNTFLGAIKIEALLPQTDAVAAGSNAGLTPSTGTDHGALVDENPQNTTDYNSSPTVGVKDTYNYPPMTLTGTILGVQTNMYVSKSDVTVRQVCPVVRTAGVDTDGANVSPTTSFLYFSQVWQQDPNAGAPIEWTPAAIATLQAGMKVTV
jgi:hypothetical protein